MYFCSSDVLCLRSRCFGCLISLQQKAAAKKMLVFFRPFWMNKSLNILSVAPDRVQNKFNYGLHKKKLFMYKYPPPQKRRKQTNTGRKIQKGTLV